MKKKERKDGLKFAFLSSIKTCCAKKALDARLAESIEGMITHTDFTPATIIAQCRQAREPGLKKIHVLSWERRVASGSRRPAFIKWLHTKPSAPNLSSTTWLTKHRRIDLNQPSYECWIFSPRGTSADPRISCLLRPPTPSFRAS